jgi:hypothetical protein
MSKPTILLVGGLERLDGHYRDAPPGLEVDAVYVDSVTLERRAEAADAIVLVTGHISHAAALKVRTIARRRNVPLVSALTPSISSVRNAVGTALLSVRRAMPAA